MQFPNINLAELTPNPDWARLPLFDRTGWARVRFGDVVANVNETCDPVEAGLERLIGLEHMGPGSLHVLEWGNVADGTTFTRRCKPGQVLFGKRRAYQRKVAVAEFEAVVSGDIYVMTPKNDRLMPELLPFICMSDRFFDHAVGTSAGSLSPRTNWSSLASFEFDLPQLDQQRRIAEILWAIDESIQSSQEVRRSLQETRVQYFEEQFLVGTESNPETLRTLGDALERIVAGKSPKASSKPADQNNYGVLKVSAVGENGYQEKENKALLSRGDFVPELEAKPGMILVTRCNAMVTGIARACRVKYTRPGLMLSDKTLHLVPNCRVVEEAFLFEGLVSSKFRNYVERSASGTEAKNISQHSLKNAPF